MPTKVQLINHLPRFLLKISDLSGISSNPVWVQARRWWRGRSEPGAEQGETRMISRRILAVIVVACGGATALAAEVVSVPGSSAQYSTPVQTTSGGKPVQLVLTGTAVRQKFYFNVYAIGSYIQQGAGVRTAEDLAASDSPKCLHLILERAVTGKDLGEAFRSAIRLNYPEPAFVAEMDQLVQALQNHTTQKGDQILLTHIPGVGLHCVLVGKADFTIKNAQFSRAVWDIYLGKNNLGDAIKKGLVSRL